MAIYNIEWKSSAAKELRKLVGTERTFRLRIDAYGVIYNVYKSELLIEILRVRHRREAYKR